MQITSVVAALLFVGSVGWLDWLWIKYIMIMLDDRRRVRAHLEDLRNRGHATYFIKWRDAGMLIRNKAYRRLEYLGSIESDEEPTLHLMMLGLVILFQVVIAGCIASPAMIGLS